jgi:hypothetical protein
MGEDCGMIPTDHPAAAPASLEEIQKEWVELKLKVGGLEAGQEILEKENKALRFLLERTIEHRQKSHGELVLILAGLVGKLPINDVGFTVSKLVEHNAHVSEILTTLLKGKAEEGMPQPASLKQFEQTKRDLALALKPAVAELIKLDVPFEPEMLQSLATQPELFFSHKVVRANRCFVKGQVPRERIVKEFGEEALEFFNDTTTDAKLNPRPKPEEIVLAFKVDFESLLQHATLPPDKRQKLLALHQQIQRSRALTEQSRAQKISFAKLSFMLELLNYYKNQSTEASEGVYAQRLPGLIEQMIISSSQQSRLNEKLIAPAESLLAFIINQDQRHMAVNNVGKGGGLARTLKFVLKFRTENPAEPNQLMPEFVKHLVPAEKSAPALAVVLRLIKPDMQRLFVRTVKSLDKLPRAEAEALSQALATELGLVELPDEANMRAVPPEMAKQMAWENIKELIAQRAEPAVIAAAIRDRLRANYNAEELKQSWLVLIEADVMTLIRTFCQLPYLPDGSTDAIAQNVMETYVRRLTHEKYSATYNKVVNSLKNMCQANPSSPTLVNFLALIKWVDADAAKKLSAEVQMPVAG